MKARKKGDGEATEFETVEQPTEPIDAQPQLDVQECVVQIDGLVEQIASVAVNLPTNLRITLTKLAEAKKWLLEHDEYERRKAAIYERAARTAARSPEPVQPVENVQ